MNKLLLTIRSKRDYNQINKLLMRYIDTQDNNIIDKINLNYSILSVNTSDSFFSRMSS